MTENQKKQIEQYRQQGFSYTVISRKMSIPINSIKTYCKRHGFGGIGKQNKVMVDRIAFENFLKAKKHIEK